MPDEFPPDYVPPGAPAAGTTCIIPRLLDDLASMADTQAMTVGGTGSLTGLATAQLAVPRAQLINGLIGFRQTAEPLIGELFDELTMLSQKVRSGALTISDQDATNASEFCTVNGR